LTFSFILYTINNNINKNINKGCAPQNRKEEGMPTDKNTALRILVRMTKIREEEWLKLIEARRNLIKKDLNSFTLKELGETKCLRKNYDGYDRELCVKLNFDNPEIITNSQELSLRMQGLFHCQSWDKIKYDYPRGFSEGTIQIWGLARSGDWIIAEVIFTGTAGYKYRKFETAKTVKIEKVDLATIIAKTGEKPIEIWETLGESVKEWTERCKKLYEHVLKIRKTIETEDEALSLITHLPIFD